MEKDFICQGDFTAQDPPNSDCTVLLSNHPENNPESNSHLHQESFTSLDESCFSQRKRILLSCHEQILAKVRQQRLVSKNLSEMLHPRSPTPLPNDEQFQNGTDSSPVIVSVRPISQTVSGSMKLSYTIKDGFISKSLQGTPQNIECHKQMTIPDIRVDGPSTPTETNPLSVGPKYLKQMMIPESPGDDTRLQDSEAKCLQEIKINEILADDTSIPAETNLQEVWAEHLDQIGIPENLDGNQTETNLLEVGDERLEQVLEWIPEGFYGNQKAEYHEELNMPYSLEDDRCGLRRSVCGIQNSSSSLEPLDWVKSVGPDHTRTVLYSSPSVDNGIKNKHDNEVIEEQYLHPVKKRKVKK